ncbi:MAG: J domain-containing protein [Microcystis aeruginosa Ma_QC_Ch_20071001_S25]|uniref:J domain-containing protein n=7 Tax=Microcystis TaxID=1125 RepID=A0A552IQA6_9CHRO|nr:MULTISPECIES: J domain-containing protein [Microcystis]MCA2764811.1 J domain-containing protein [Microcystis sp. M151S2]MCA2902826.1 J domain-containing protein [Microcystis sp. M035S1]MCE2664560.1 J domain-containing protein [Microcystis sp. 53602_E8]MCU7242368.1 J domain-containing protein [Microcystis aeruginosa WS75]MCZ8161379.1 J domain-containing protein [Microcystis sp. LE19-196.1B]MCZ8274491.1 J domain-containing protein [Microcystis sp. LE19-4.1E]MCZ8364820.1 J domain-containing 
MTFERDNSQTTSRVIAANSRFANTYYAILGLHPSASVIEVRRAYRELSKRYHPDTTELSPEVATVKFQRLNEAYATLSNPDRRSLYDLQIGYSRWNVIQTIPDSDEPIANRSAYLDPTDRPLSSGEIFALFILALTLLGCLLLAVIIAMLRGENAVTVAQLFLI